MREKQDHIEKLPSSVKAFSEQATLAALAYLDRTRAATKLEPNLFGVHIPGADFQKLIYPDGTVSTRGSKWFYANALRKTGEIQTTNVGRRKALYKVNETVYRLLQNHLDLQKSVATKLGLNEAPIQVDPLAEHVLTRLENLDNISRKKALEQEIAKIDAEIKQEQENMNLDFRKVVLEVIDDLKREIDDIGRYEHQAKLDLNSARQYWRGLDKQLKRLQADLADQEDVLAAHKQSFPLI